MRGVSQPAESEWSGDPELLAGHWDDLPPEAFDDHLGLSPEDYPALFPDPDTKRLQDEAATAAYRAGTLAVDDGMPNLIPAVAAASGDLLAKSDADLVGTVRACGELMALVKSWMYQSVAEFAARRPGRARDRRAEAAELEREGPDGPGEMPGPGEPPRTPSREMIQELMLAMDWTEYRASLAKVLARNPDLKQELLCLLARAGPGGGQDTDHEPPATRCDLDHVIPFDKGGRTCDCDIGPECRTHHQLKQLPGWHLARDGDGTFTWTTPAGLAYRQEPYPYPV